MKSLLLACSFILGACSSKSTGDSISDTTQAAGTATSSPETSTQTKQFEIKGLETLIVQNTKGVVVIRETTGASRVVSEKKKFGETCEMIIEPHDKKLGVIVKNRGIINTDDCEVNFEIFVPKTVTVEAKLGAGELKIRGLESKLSYELGAGLVEAEGRFAEVTGQAGSGKVNIKGLVGGGTLKAGSSDFALEYSKTPLKGVLSIEVASGNATVSFPKGSKVRVELQSVTGQLTNDLGNSPQSDFEVAMKAASGNLKVLAR